MILFYLPIGIVGIWRWGVWLLRKITSYFYRAPEGTYATTLSIVVPVYNENPKLFSRALSSWKANNPDEIIAVIDYSDTTNIQLFRAFKKTYKGARLVITEKPGKRPALADGVKIAESEIIALVDSDTLWSPGMKSKIIGPFSDGEVGGVVTRQDVLDTNTLARRLFKILLDDRYLLEYPFLSVVSDALLCLSGRTAIYRRIAIADKMEKLVTETFWGKRMISGDDKTLTRLVQRDGWKTRYLRDVKVYTAGTLGICDFMKQKVRWSRNGLRSDSQVLFSGWLWKRHTMLALHMLDKFVSPLTILLAPIYFVVSIVVGHWIIAAVILLWWLLSRTIKIYPHLKEKPQDIFILPSYILMSFVMAIVKLYAFVTMDEQGWITRWDKIRLVPAGFLKRSLSFTVTGAFILSLFFLVFSYKNQAVLRSQAESQYARNVKEEERVKGLSLIDHDKPRISEANIQEEKTTLSREGQDDPYGYYVIKRGDTIPLLRWRFNLPRTARILDAKSKSALSGVAYLRPGQRIAITREDLRTPISPDIVKSSLSFKFPRVYYAAATNTIFVKQTGTSVSLSRIRRALGPARKNILEETTPGEWTLRSNLYIGKGVVLVVDGSEASKLKIRSNPGESLWIRSESGAMLFSNTAVTSWDETANTPDIHDDDGRSYITAKNSGRMDIINSDIGYLGNVGSPKRGGLFGGSYGVSWKIRNNGFRDSLLSGVVMNSTFHNNYFGLYTFGATAMHIANNEFYENIEYGLDPHDDSNNMLIENNKAYNNGNHGIILSRRCFDNTIVGNESHDNRLHGIMLDRESNNNLVQGNTVFRNTDGIALYESSGNLVLENRAFDNVRGLRLNAGSKSNYVEGNDFIRNSRGVYVYDQSENNIVVNNQVKYNDIGVTIKNASRNVLYDNYKTFDNKKEGRVTADAYENDIQ